MKKILAIITMISFLSPVFASENCVDLLKRSMILNRLALKNLNSLEGNLRVESQTILNWAQLTDQALRSRAIIPTSGMRKNAAELVNQANVLNQFNQDLDDEIMLINTAAIDCI